MARVGNVEDDDKVSVFVNEDVGGVVANTDGDFDQRQDDGLDYLVDSVSTTPAVLPYQLPIPNCFSIRLSSSAFECLALYFRIANSNFVLSAILVTLFCEFEARYSLKLGQINMLTSLRNLLFRVDSS